MSNNGEGWVFLKKPSDGTRRSVGAWVDAIASGIDLSPPADENLTAVPAERADEAAKPQSNNSGRPDKDRRSQLEQSASKQSDHANEDAAKSSIRRTTAG